jgi:hypothetical protein
MTITDAGALIFEIADSEQVSVTATASGTPFGVVYTLEDDSGVLDTNNLTDGQPHSFTAKSANRFAQLRLDFAFVPPSFDGSYSLTIRGKIGEDTFADQYPGGIPLVSNIYTFKVR